MIEQELYEYLKLLGVDVYPQKAKDNAKTPYLTYSLVFGQPKQMPSGDISFVKSSWQIDVFEESSLKAKMLRDRVIKSIRDFPSYSSGLSYRDGYEERVKVYRQIIEFYTKENTGECNGN